MKITKKIVAGALSLAVVFGTNVYTPLLPSAEAVETEISDFHAETFFVYTGTYSEQQFPILEYYYPSEDISGTNYKHRKSYYQGELPDDLKYGDVFVTEDDVVTTLDEYTGCTYELNKDTKLVDAGNCTDIMELRSLTVDSNVYDGMPMPPAFSIFTFRLSDEADNAYYYSFDSYGSDLGMNISGAAEGDVLSFAVYKDSAIIPIAAPSAPEILIGDVNHDNEFNISDVVLLQKWLLAVPDTHLVNWKAADLCEDDILNVFDLCFMKRHLTAVKTGA